MQPAISFNAVRDFNRAAPALASVAIPPGWHRVEVYRDYYGTANARVVTHDNVPLDTQHNGFGWAKRRLYNSDLLKGMKPAMLRQFDLAAEALFAGLHLQPGRDIPPPNAPVAALKSALRALLSDYETLAGEGVCDCPHERYNEGQVCGACLARLAIDP